MATNAVLAKLAIQISANTAELGKALNQSQSQLKGFQNGVLSIGKALGLTFGAAEIFNGIKAAIGIMAQFESTMSEVKAITGATGKEFEALQKDALKLGSATKFTAREVGQLQVAYGRLGFNTQEILDATAATLDLAAATGEDLAKSADVAGSTVRGFGLEARETQRIVDVMAASFNKTALGLDNFTESMKYVAPIAAAANISVEETTALLGVLADAGIRGSSAGTALRKIFGDLSKDGRPVNERLDELGKKGITLSDSFDEVGRTAQTALLVLTKNRDKADELTRAFSNVEGEAARMARTMSDNLAGDVTKLSSAWEGLILSLSNTGILRRATGALTGLLGALSGSNGDLFVGVSQLAQELSDGLDVSGARFKDFIGELQKLRQEAGKPIDTNVVQELSDKYKLTEDQANNLYKAILKVNQAASFRETVIDQFKKFQGQGDLTSNLDSYTEGLYRLIVAEQSRLEQLKRANIDGSPFDAEIADSKKLIDSYYERIGILNEYASTFTKSEAKIQAATAVTIKNLNYYQDSLKKVNEAFESLALKTDLEVEIKIGDNTYKEFNRFTENTLSGLRILAAESAGLENFIERVNRLKKSFQDVGELVIKPPDLTPLLDGVKTITETAGALTFEKEVTSFEAVVARFEAGLAKMAVKTKTTTSAVKKEFIDMSPLISTALIGVADAIGQAAVGVGNFGDNIIKVVAGFARQLGEILIATGVGILAAEALITNPYTAIIAGVALVALASAASAAIGGAHSKSFGGGGSGGGGGVSGSVQPLDKLSLDPSEQIILVGGEIKWNGSALVLALDRANKSKQRTG